MPILRTLNEAFFATWSPEMAYLLGYFAADGCMIRNKRGSHYVEFTSCDRELLETVVRVTGASHQISRRPSYNPEWKAQYRVQVGSKQWFDDLSRLGFTQDKSHTLSFPPVPETLLGHFVRGYFDGDGCAYFSHVRSGGRKRWVLLTLFTSGSRAFLEVLHGRLRRHSINGGSMCRKDRGFELKYSSRDSLALSQLMYNNAEVAGLFLLRKREKLERAIQALGLGANVRS